MEVYQCVILTMVLGCVMFQSASGVARIKRSTDESLRDPGTYIVHFKDSATDAQLQQFTKQLYKSSGRKTNFKVNIISKYPSIKCSTMTLSESALKWVSALCL